MKPPIETKDAMAGCLQGRVRRRSKPKLTMEDYRTIYEVIEMVFERARKRKPKCDDCSEILTRQNFRRRKTFDSDCGVKFRICDDCDDQRKLGDVP